MPPDQDDDGDGSAGDGPDGGDGVTVPSPVLEVLEDPEQGRYRLPYLVGLLDDDDVSHRLCAAWAIPLVVEARPDMLEYAVERLLDRLSEDAPLEVKHTLDYLAARYPRAVDRTLVEMEEETEVRARELMYETGGGFARSDYLARTEGDRGVGRTRVAAGSNATDPRRTYTGGEPDQREVEARRSDEAGGRAGAEDDEAADDGATDRVTRGVLASVSDRLSGIVEASEFDEFDVLTEGDHRRYAEVYRAMGVVDDRELPVALHVFDLPPSDREAFVRGFVEALEAWERLGDHENVVRVYDWGWQPRPWAAVEYTAHDLTDRDPMTVETGLWNALQLVDAVSEAHQRGVVHAALDPAAVAYYGNALTDSARQRPLLANYGLAAPYRSAFPDDDRLDPRYAAPELLDDSFGQVDHRTDVYQLGLLVYRLTTGEHPVDGDGDVRRQVLEGDPPRPSAVVDGAPEALDQVVAKATAAGRLTRYETVNHLGRELQSIYEALPDAG